MDKKNILTNYCKTIPEPIEVELKNDHQQKNSKDSPNSEVEKTFNDQPINANYVKKKQFEKLFRDIRYSKKL